MLHFRIQLLLSSTLKSVQAVRGRQKKVKLVNAIFINSYFCFSGGRGYSGRGGGVSGGSRGSMRGGEQFDFVSLHGIFGIRYLESYCS